MTAANNNTEYRDFTRFINGEMPLAVWKSYQEGIKTHPKSVKAVEQLERISKLAKQWTDGLVLATETASEMKRILSEEEN